jgi:hypothetical protein
MTAGLEGGDKVVYILSRNSLFGFFSLSKPNIEPFIQTTIKLKRFSSLEML